MSRGLGRVTSNISLSLHLSLKTGFEIVMGREKVLLLGVVRMPGGKPGGWGMAWGIEGELGATLQLCRVPPDQTGF